ncbi:hypothetical protein [Saccharothrix sp. ST-888]|uniref:hypothetical protein n=1 Tax=Saccharothrix sp. ST-888 TaxID=1427391 RepID=UPI0005ECABFB|nr:hypothetical protein [Saccharothrix sp. ST-888]KJK57211.1 hypothetical protein UK12_18025 [Saccharothrix sp. ST-888]
MAALLAVGALVTTGCSDGDKAAPVPTRAVSESSAPGQLTVKVGSTEDMPAVTITGATVRPGADGEGELAMVVHNDSSIPEHLVMISSSVMGGSVLKAPGNGGTVPPVGVLLPPGSSATFGTQDGYHVVLQHLNVPSGAKEVPVSVLFARLGMVQLKAIAGEKQG